MMKGKEEKRVPQLRFPEFTDDWEQRKLGEVADVRDGTHDSPKYVQEGHPFITSKNVSNGFINYEDVQYINDEDYEEINKRSKVDIHDILMGMIGTIGNLALIRKEPDFAIKNVALIKYTGGINYQFLYQVLQAEYVRNQLSSGIDGGTQKFVSLKKIRELNIVYPAVQEQQQIGYYFAKLDNLITLHQRKLEKLKELRKGVMKKLFSQEVRFKADDGSEFPKWEEKRLSGLFGKVIEKNRLDLPALTIIQGYGTIRRDESERKITYDEKGLKNYKAVQKDDFIVHLRSFEGGLEIANQDGIVSPAYHVYRGNDEVHPLFYYPYFRSSSFIKGKLAVCVTGVRDGKNIEMGAFDELLIPHPCLAEQQKIAECLSALDDVIEKQKATLAAWEELKKGLLQQMFV